MKRKLTATLSSLLIFACTLFGVMQPAQASSVNNYFLNVQDLPSGFANLNTEKLASFCQPLGYLGYTSGFLKRTDQGQAGFLCSTIQDLAVFVDQDEKSSRDNYWTSALTNQDSFIETLGSVESSKNIEVIPTEKIGNISEGVRINYGDMNIEFLFFKRDSILVSLISVYPPGFPNPPMTTIASKIDARILEDSLATQWLHKGIADIGQLVRGQDFDFIINSAERGKNYSNYSEPEPGYENLAVDVTIFSHTNRGVSANIFNAAVTDEAGYQYGPTFNSKEPVLRSQSDLFADQKARGWITFEIPKYSDSVLFEYQLIGELPIRVAISD